jgi:hypothetical protein
MYKRTEKQKKKKKGKKEVLCGHDDHAGYIYKFIQWGIV